MLCKFYFTHYDLLAAQIQRIQTRIRMRRASPCRETQLCTGTRCFIANDGRYSSPLQTRHKCIVDILDVCSPAEAQIYSRTCYDELGNVSADLKLSYAVPTVLPSQDSSRNTPSQEFTLFELIIPKRKILSPRIMMTFIIISALASGFISEFILNSA